MNGRESFKFYLIYDRRFKMNSPLDHFWHNAFLFHERYYFSAYVKKICNVYGVNAVKETKMTLKIRYY